jgi:hypothetical protein
MKMSLSINDCKNLLATKQGLSPIWSRESRYNCEKQGFLNPDLSLSDTGQKKVERLECYVSALKKGIPLEQRTGNRSQDAANENWKSILIQEKPCIIGSHMCAYVGQKHLSLFKTSPAVESENEKSVRTDISKSAGSKNLMRYDPTWYQIEDLPGLETVVFKRRLGNNIIRIQAKYYDLACSLWDQSLTWFVSPIPESPIIARVQNRNIGLKDGVVAVIMPLVTPGWSTPE